MKRITAILALLLLSWASLAWAHPVALGLSVSPQKVEITGHLRYEVVAEWPAGWAVAPPRLAPEEGMFDAACKAPVVTQKPDGGGRLVVSCELIAYEPGTVEVPRPAIAINGPDGFHEIDHPPAATVEVIGPLVGEQPKPLKAQEKLTRNWGKIAAIVGGVSAGLLLIGLLIWVIVRKLRGREKKVKEKPKDPPDVIALRRLDSPELDKLLRQGNSKPYYSELTEIVRDYLEGRYGLPAPERTTSEVMAELEKHPLNEHRAFLYDLLSTADFTKFAGVDIARSRWEADRVQSRAFIEKTRQPEPEPVKTEEQS